MSIDINCSPLIGYYFGAQTILFREKKTTVFAELNPFFSEARSPYRLADSIFQNRSIPEDRRGSPKRTVRWLLKAGFTPSLRQREIVFLSPKQEGLPEDIPIEKPDPTRCLFYFDRSIELLCQKGVTIPLLPSMQGGKALEDTKKLDRFMELAKELDEEGNHEQAIAMLGIGFTYTDKTSDFALLPPLLAKTEPSTRAPLAYLYLAKRYLEENNVHKAEEAIKHAYTLLPEEEIKAAYAATLMLNQNYDAAHDLFSQLGKKADTTTEQGKQNALLYWEQALECNPGNPDIYHQIAPHCDHNHILANLFFTGSLHLKQTHPERSRELEKQARDLDPENPLLYLPQLGALDENHPEFIDLCRKIGRLFKKRGDLSMSLYYLKIAARSRVSEDLKRLDKLILKLAYSQEQAGNWPEAEKIYRMAHKQETGFESSFKLARLVARREPIEAIRLFYTLSVKSMVTQELDKVKRCVEQIRLFDPLLKTLNEQEQQHLTMQTLILQLFDQLASTQQEIIALKEKAPHNNNNHASPSLLVSEDVLQQTIPLEQPLSAEEARLAALALEKQERVQAMSFGAEKWNRYFGDVGTEPPLPPNILDILSGPCPIWAGKTIGETHKLVLVPATVNGTPLTLDLLEQLIQSPRQGHATKYHYYYGEVKKKHGSSSLPSHWILMTKDVLPGSRNQPYATQQKQVAALEGGYQVPQLLEAAVCILMEHVETGTRLFSDDPWIYTRCQEAVTGYQTFIVGGFAADGLYVYFDLDNDDNGVAGLRIF